MFFNTIKASTLARALTLLPALGLSTFLDAATPTSVSLQTSTKQSIGGRGDNWTLTWAKDGSTLVTMDDGNWFSSSSNKYSHAMYRIRYPSSSSSDFSMSNVSRLTNYPVFSFKESCSFGYGLLSVDGVIYSMVSRCNGVNWNQFDAMKLLKSYDNGSTWYRVDKNGGEDYMGPWDSARDSRDSGEYFFYKGDGYSHYDSAKGQVTYYPFVYNTFVQAGKDYAEGLARDGYVYIYSPDPKHASKLNLARVKHYDLDVRANWRYFERYDSNGNPVWTSNIQNRGVVHSLRKTDSSGNPISWYSGLPDVVYNKGLGKYIMVNGGMYAKTYNGTDASTNNGSGSLTFLYSDNPYGPWKELKHIDHFTSTSSFERTYQPKLDPKNISSDGTRMTLIWSDHAGPFSSKYYTFNQMDIRIGTTDDSSSGGGDDGTTGGSAGSPTGGGVIVDSSTPTAGTSLEAENMSLSGMTIEKGSLIKVSSSSQDATGSATLSFGESSGTYDVNLRVLGEDDGQSTVKLYVNGKYIGTKTFPLKNSYTTLTFDDVSISKGDSVKLVGKKDGWATFARMDGISFVKASDGSTAEPESEPVESPTEGGSTSFSSSMEARSMQLSGYTLEGSDRIKVSSGSANATGSASASFSGNSGSYDVDVDVLAEDDGQSTIDLYVNGNRIGSKTMSRVARQETLSFAGVSISKGQQIKIVGKKDGYATFARVYRVRVSGDSGSSTDGGSTAEPSEPTQPSGTGSMTAEAEDMSRSGYSVEGGARIYVSSGSSNATGSASFKATVSSGSYDVTARVLAEDDGQSTLALYVDGVYKGKETFPRKAAYATLSFSNVYITQGQTIKIVGKKDGYATKARVDSVTIQ